MIYRSKTDHYIMAAWQGQSNCCHGRLYIHTFSGMYLATPPLLFCRMFSSTLAGSNHAAVTIEGQS